MAATQRQAPALPRATLRDTLLLLGDVVLPVVARGVIIRRPRVLALAERLQLDRRAVRRMQALRSTYGTGPLLLPIPLRPQAVVLSPADAIRVLDETPDPFRTDSKEKRAALGHFQPEGVLISHGVNRADRRRFNEGVLQSGVPAHTLAERFLTVVHDEIGRLLQDAEEAGELTWDAFAPAWFRVVRRVVLGDGAADDVELADMLASLRGDANWAFLVPRRDGLRRRFLARLGDSIARAEEGSLAAMMAELPTSDRTASIHQVPQWLFAFDAAGIATFRALALLVTQPGAESSAQAEIATHPRSSRIVLPYLRASLLESVRLWPTTPMILRQTATETAWGSATMPRGTGVLIFAPYFHRDDRRLEIAHRFSPEIWLNGPPPETRALVPFSDGPAACPGRNLVLLLTSAVMAGLLDAHTLTLASPSPLTPGAPIPATLNNYALRFALTPRES
jgi:cytochrome P450